MLDFLPALYWLPSKSGAKGVVDIDFATVRTISSTGLCVFLLRVLGLLGTSRVPRLKWLENEQQRKVLEDLGAFKILSLAETPSQQELLLDQFSFPSFHSVPKSGAVSLPVYRLRFPKSERRAPLKPFKRWILKELTTLTHGLDFEPNGLVMLVSEIAKNTADHANADALFALDLCPLESSEYRLTFCFGDLGLGIKKHVQQMLPRDEAIRRDAHWSLYESYRFALKSGFTTSQSALNKGHGMSIIIDCASDLGVHLSVFDANSRGLLNTFTEIQNPTHAGVRRIFHNIGHDVGFFLFWGT